MVSQIIFRDKSERPTVPADSAKKFTGAAKKNEKDVSSIEATKPSKAEPAKPIISSKPVIRKPTTPYSALRLLKQLDTDEDDSDSESSSYEPAKEPPKSTQQTPVV